MRIAIPLEICDSLRIDRWSHVASGNKKGIATLIKEANKQLDIIASSGIATISRSIYIQEFKERCLAA